MLTQLLNWRTLLTAMAIAIVTGTIFYSNYLSRKIAAEERHKVNVWAESLKTRSITNDQSALNLTSLITEENTDIPIIETDENDKPTGNYLNVSPEKIRRDSLYLQKLVAQFRQEHECIVVEISKNPVLFNRYYYGDSLLLKEVRYYPMIQLFIVALFIIVTLIMVSTRNKSTQNQVWAGMARETAHQLGTPISSLEGWVEMLREKPESRQIASEMHKDVERLKLVSDRFGKIGSTPQLVETDLLVQARNMLQYIGRRSSERVRLRMEDGGLPVLNACINPLLFDWVLENLLKNALDALDGKGEIIVSFREESQQVRIDVTDTGKGISKKNLPRVFKPGFTTKKRGWGLGLSLSKRIIEQYHKGHLFVKWSEPGKGTTFRILLPKTPPDGH